jgi:hypothetical protein
MLISTIEAADDRPLEPWPPASFAPPLAARSFLEPWIELLEGRRADLVEPAITVGRPLRGSG